MRFMEAFWPPLIEKYPPLGQPRLAFVPCCRSQEQSREQFFRFYKLILIDLYQIYLKTLANDDLQELFPGTLGRPSSLYLEVSCGR